MSKRPTMFGSGRMRTPSLFSSTTGFLTGSSINGERDLREEFDKLIYGPNKDGKGSHGHPCVLRRARRKPDGYPLPCECVQGSPNGQGNPHCQYCFGEGNLWDEEWAMTYTMFLGPDGGQANKIIKMNPGNIRTDYKIFFFRYDTGILYGDKIVEILLDEEGQPTAEPPIRYAIYRPETIRNYRSDNGRIEYIAVYCREFDSIRSDNP